MHTAARSTILICLAIGQPSLAQGERLWTTRHPIGSSLSAGTSGAITTPDGTTFQIATNGPSSNTDIFTAATTDGGATLWTKTFNGPQQNWHDQARGIAASPSGEVYVVGNVPGPGNYSNVLLLKYDATTGSQLNFIQYSSGPFTSEYGGTVGVDPAGNVYIGGGTVGDGGDALFVSFTAGGQFRWKQSWDGPAFAPFSQDHADLVKIAPDGNPVFMIHGVMSSQHPDFVIQKRDAGTGAIVWHSTWGVNGGDFANDMEIDAQGDIYVTGTGINGTDKYSTIKLSGQNGQLIWQAYDQNGADDTAVALTLDDQGGVYITGSVDPEGNQSNFNNDFYTVKRDAGTGAFLWSHRYGDPCVGCGDFPSDVRVDSAGNVLVVGVSSSAPYSSDTIMFILDSASGLEKSRVVVENGKPESGGAGQILFDAQENIYVSGGVSDANTGQKETSLMKFASLSVGGCYADCDGSGVLDFFDFLCFQNEFASGAASADCDSSGSLDFFDFLCFQNEFAGGCP